MCVAVALTCVGLFQLTEFETNFFSIDKFGGDKDKAPMVQEERVNRALKVSSIVPMPIGCMIISISHKNHLKKNDGENILVGSEKLTFYFLDPFF